MDPFIILTIGVIFVILAIAVLKIHPFFALILAAVVVGMMPTEGSPVLTAETGEESVRAWFLQAKGAFSRTTAGLGSTAGKIGVVIALAAIIGQCLMASGAADKITRRLLAFMGEKRANWALLGSGYVLSVPVFFDTVFYMLVPLARALRMRTGKHYLRYILAICAGGVVTHSLVPPTPGPLAMAAGLQIDLGVAILGGFLIGLPIAIFSGIVFPVILTRFVDLPMRDAPGSSQDELQEIVSRDEAKLPSLFAAAFPVILPVILITANSIVQAPIHEAVGKEEFRARAAGLAEPEVQRLKNVVREEQRTTLSTVSDFFGEKNFALFLAAGMTIWVLKRQRKYGLKELFRSLEPAFASAGVIILITSAGGAFGTMIQGTGIREAITELIKDQDTGTAAETTRNLGILLILISFAGASILKVAQGSGTVSMITTAAVMAPILTEIEKLPGGLPYHPIYIFASIAFGSKVVSWMNDSGFWVVSKMSGFTEREALRTWTVQLGVMGILGLVEVLILSQVLPLV